MSEEKQIVVYQASPEAEARMKAALEKYEQDLHQASERRTRDEDLRKLPEALSRFRDGKLLNPKTRKLLKDILEEDTIRRRNRRGIPASQED